MEITALMALLHVHLYQQILVMMKCIQQVLYKLPTISMWPLSFVDIRPLMTMVPDICPARSEKGEILCCLAPETDSVEHLSSVQFLRCTVLATVVLCLLPLTCQCVPV